MKEIHEFLALCDLWELFILLICRIIIFLEVALFNFIRFHTMHVHIVSRKDSWEPYVDFWRFIFLILFDFVNSPLRIFFFIAFKREWLIWERHMDWLPPPICPNLGRSISTTRVLALDWESNPDLFVTWTDTLITKKHWPEQNSIFRSFSSLFLSTFCTISSCLDLYRLEKLFFWIPGYFQAWFEAPLAFAVIWKLPSVRTSRLYFA